ncbi:UbiA prenyltransferase family-domain-containing protein, partial [Lineolata rhizophorae]
ATTSLASPRTTSLILRLSHTKPTDSVSAALLPCRLASTAINPDVLPPYAPPTTGLVSVLPPALIPYAELIRLDKPTGAYYLFLPCLWSTFLASIFVTPLPSPLALAGTTALFAAGALIMRGAGCTINDLWDRSLDARVARTRLRPLARGAVSPTSALAFAGGQLLAGLVVLLQFPQPACFLYATPSLLFVAAYPLAKRVTYYPQLVLGLTFSWGAVMGFPALGVSLLDGSAQSDLALLAAAALYASNVAWTVLYDTVYAHMDVADDAAAGIKSIALAHPSPATAKAIMSALASAQVGLLGVAGWAAGLGPVFWVGSCGGAAGALATMIWKVRLESVKDCWWWFKWGCWFVGGAVGAGLVGEYGVRYAQ